MALLPYKGFTAELGSQWGSEDFQRRYADAANLEKSKPGAGATRTLPGTLNDLVARFYALHFPTLEPRARKDYRSIIEPLRQQHGHRRVAHMRLRHVLEVKAALSATPTQANKTIKRLGQLLDLAIKLEWRTDNPVRAADLFKIGGSGFHTWDEGGIAQFYAMHPPGSAAHRALTLMLFTGAARADAVKLGRGNLTDGRLSYRRLKTRKNPSGILIDIPVHEQLAKALTLVPDGAFTFLETATAARAPRPGSARGCGNGATLRSCRSVRRTGFARPYAGDSPRRVLRRIKSCRFRGISRSLRRNGIARRSAGRTSPTRQSRSCQPGRKANKP